MSKKKQAKVLFFDVENFPLESYTWGIWDQTIGLNQIKHDFTILSWAAKWMDSKVVMYEDVSKQKNLRDDKAILKSIWKLLDEADVVVTQNGTKFDVKKLNARFIYHGFPPVSSFEHIDTLKLARKYFAFTSNSLEAMSNFLNTEYKKLKHKKFPGFELWAECLKGNKEAWKEMMIYNKQDVKALESVYNKLIIWDGDKTVNFNKYREDDDYICKCGAKNSRIKYGFRYAKTLRYQRYRCSACGAPSSDNKAIKK